LVIPVVLEKEVATNDKEVQHECWYTGDHDLIPPDCIDRKPISPSPDLAREIALGILGGRRGRYHPSQHFRDQMAERDFDVFDMEYAIRNGTCVKGGEFCEEFRNHKYAFRANIDGIDFEAVFALSAVHDLIRSPLMVLITGCFKNASGKRSKSY
jgi:hypothetical protein